MKNRFQLIQRGRRGGRFYCVDSQTGRRENLGTKDSDEATQLVLAKNQSVRRPALSLQMAKALLTHLPGRIADDGFGGLLEGAIRGLAAQVAFLQVLLACKGPRGCYYKSHGESD